MTGMEAVVLGLIQGFTEFLPVSSSGHLAVAHRLFGLEQGSLTFDIWLHVGT
ncbi:MAG: undecaprenyl-diphosphate phosphatase, partial [Alicyclobacillaceae bacterium]|nr:undecaprenyl-diphosphate phosphatase [Alicyclobacillaceae bacterium]